MQLFWLRNITMGFIVAMMLLAVFALEIDLPLMPLCFILTIMALANLATRKLIGGDNGISQSSIFNQLSIDVIAFSLILYFAGGATNPFTFFYLIPLAISATIIPGRQTWILAALTVVAYSLLLKFYVPLAYFGHDHQNMVASDDLFNQHVIGMWFGFLLSASLVTWFVTYLSKELKQRERDIEEARRRELRDQQMIMLGTLAAGTAHELGTPLASLSVVAGEITRNYDPVENSELFWHQEILRQQVGRCKEILSVLSDTVGQSRAETGHPVAAQAFIELVVSRWRRHRESANSHTFFPDYPITGNLIYDKTIDQAMTNLLNNSADESASRVNIAISSNERELYFDIIDDGEGISDEKIEMAGEVSFSSKPNGMGIGLFLALTTLRRIGASVCFSRLNPGTRTRVVLPFL
ncbi:MAG: HAMP domain-containing histidine kinase [Gammaproteobacteria bacterium]|nr:HAMP domain-containing histidine kinase [Gammaproteobacteria bacterium]